MFRPQSIATVWIVLAVAASAAACSTTTSITTPTSENPESCSDALPVGRSTVSVKSDGGDHVVYIHVPPLPAGVDVIPTVISFHGLTYTGPEMEEYTNFEELSASEGFIVVHPDGLIATEGDTLLTFGQGWEIAPDFVSPQRDDLVFATDLVSELIRE